MVGTVIHSVPYKMNSKVSGVKIYPYVVEDVLN